MDATNNIGLSKPDYNNIADIEVINENSNIIDEQFSPNKCVRTVNGVAPVNYNVTVDTGVTSFNGATGDVTYAERSVKQLIDIIYPIGCYFDTTDTKFNPNTSWAGTTWEKITDGRALIAGGNSYNIGTSYGNATHKLIVNELPSHGHSATVSEDGNHTHSASASTSGNHTHTYYTPERPAYNNDEGKYGGNTWNVDASGTYNTGESGSHSHNISVDNAGKHRHTVTIGNTGSNIAFSLLPPSTAVARWHRLA